VEIAKNEHEPWKNRSACGKHSCFTVEWHHWPTPAHDPGSHSDIAACSVMAFPSPLDRCWIVKNSPQYLSILPALRAAVEEQWKDTQRAVASSLGDESLATGIMERAIERTARYLEDHPGSPYDVRALLSRFCRLETIRVRSQRGRLRLVDLSAVPESTLPFTTVSATDAALDAEKILADAPPKVREAMMMRYGSSESWSDVATRTATTPAAIRMSCKRYLDRIREKLGIPGAPQ
jgi:DNA-directed RNA polymerase specialized sigma24 family protein